MTATDERVDGQGTRSEAGSALALAVALIVLGAVLGLIWAWWSPPGPPAAISRDGAVAVLGETESFVAGDGRYLVLVVAAGLAAGLVTWFWRRGDRGPLVPLALAVGGVAGAALTELVGHLAGGGSFATRAYQLTDGSRAQVSIRLPLSLHMPGLVLAGPAVAVLTYGVAVAFTAHDDLGRPDPARDALRAPSSVHAGAHAQHAGGDGDAPGAAQQGQFSPQ